MMIDTVEKFRQSVSITAVKKAVEMFLLVLILAHISSHGFPLTQLCIKSCSIIFFCCMHVRKMCNINIEMSASERVWTSVDPSSRISSVKAIINIFDPSFDKPVVVVDTKPTEGCQDTSKEEAVESQTLIPLHSYLYHGKRSKRTWPRLAFSPLKLKDWRSKQIPPNFPKLGFFWYFSMIFFPFKSPSITTQTYLKSGRFFFP